MCLKSEGIQFPSFVLLSFFSTWIQVRFVVFLLFFTRFRKSSFFCFFSLLSLALFFASAPHSKTQEITLLSPWYVSSLSFRTFSLSLCSREEEEKEYESRSKVPSLRPVVFRAREIRVVFFNALRFFCKFLGEEKALSPTKNEF